MPQQQTVQNNFKEGLKTEFTGLNFPENAATDTQNCVYSYIGDVSRRGGIDYENNALKHQFNLLSVARSSFKWLNAGGDGETQILVKQEGNFLLFWRYSDATDFNGVSTTLLPINVDLNKFGLFGNNIDSTIECQYASGNGYLFVFHPNMDPIYCIYNNGSVTPNTITLQIRDTIGIPESIADNFRPTTLSTEHLYNLLNQGWTKGAGWSGTSSILSGALPLSNVNPNTSLTLTLSSQSSAGVIVPGDQIKLFISPCAGTGSNAVNNPNGAVTLIGSVTSYASPSITLQISSNNNPILNATGTWIGGNFQAQTASVSLTLVNQGFITAWFSALQNYPSNADIWWLYKDTTNAFSPSTTFANVQPTITPAPKGAFIIDPFLQDRGTVSGSSNITIVATSKRPSTGAFYAGRVFYAGVNDSFQATGDASYTTWTENIYFSQIVESPANFARCYQTNDPTSQNLFSLLPSDGGVITIPGCGNIYKLFALRYGLLVFAANGIWFISGSTGVGFTADDFTIIKISSIQSISGTSFIDMQGYPMFWNEEGIYQLVPTAQAGSAHSPDIQLDVQNLCVGTILSYYTDLPSLSKAYARGDYDPLNYIVQWCFRSTTETSIFDRYAYDSILNFNVITKAFYPYKLTATENVFGIGPVITDIKYLQLPGGKFNAPAPMLKYIIQSWLTPLGADQVGHQPLFIPSVPAISFGQEGDFTNWVDFFSTGNSQDYTSYFNTGYMLPGQALRKVQIPYIYLFSRGASGSKLSIQAIWDFAGNSVLGSTDMNSGKWSSRQIITFNQTDYTMSYRKIRLRGRGMAVQIRIQSISGQPFDLMGWSVLDQVNQVV